MRVAWTRDVGDGTDFVSEGDRLLLMGYDSHDGRGERVVLDEPAGYARPLITADGESIVFSIRRQDAVYAVAWDGSGLRRLADGFGLAVWTDPLDGVQWVYVGVDRTAAEPPAYRAVHRHRLDEPTRSEVVWDAQPITPDNFQLSPDGKRAAALLPWPAAGVADLEAGTWRALGEGCWTALSPGRRSLFWYFDGSHRNVTIVDLEADSRWRVPINGAPGVDGFEVYHPRWTNDPRALVVTGPYTAGEGANRIRAGGGQVEVYVGFFNATFTAIDEWRRVTRNDAPDFYPDAWIEPGFRWADGETTGPGGSGSIPEATGAPVVVDVRVRRDVAVPAPRDIAPYREGLQAIAYDVVQVIDGDVESPVIAVAHWIIRDGRLLADAARPAGARFRLTLDSYDARPELEGKRLVMSARDPTLPLYYDLASVDARP